MSERIMMALGDFRFETSAASYQRLSYSQSWRWPEQARIGREPAHQFTGREKTEIKLQGTLYPSFAGGLGSIEALRAIADTGEPQLLADGLGRIWGSWVILSVNDSRSMLMDNGQPRKLSFDLTLREYGEDDTLSFDGWNPLSALIGITGLF
ncbi:phage tail protein [Lamprobacter modestohalophilus]|uniref:phage tail protein n=1 Tax=Lamprobacter modestohalophilus TaxID=1064514 RepID=UPI002ADEC58F|nr:phage tail protein [Lamprobacter modestohalophilus]MEA1053387.1 phage tail protein [Lamprobacter modestohalophilus]